MADSIDNFDYAQYAGIGGLGAAAKGFVQGWQDGEDRKMKRLEMESKLEAQKTEKERNAFLDQITARDKGFKKGPNGELLEAPPTLKQQNEQVIGMVEKGMNAPTYDDEGKIVTPTWNPQSAPMKAAQMRGLYQGERLDETRNQNAIHAGKEFEDDSMLKQMKGTILNLDRAKSIMHGKTPVTAQNFAMLQQDLINAAAPGGAATEGKINRELMDTFQAKLNEVQARFGNVKDLRREQPQVFAQLEGLMNQMYSEYQRAMSQRATDIAGNYKYSTNKRVQNTVADKVSRYGLVDDKKGLLPNDGLIQPGQVDAEAAAKVQRLQELRAKAAAGGR